MMLRAFGLGAAMLSNGKPPPKPLNPGPLFGTLLIIVIGVVAAAGIARHLTVGLLVIAPLVCTALVLIGAVSHRERRAPTGGSATSIEREKRVYALLSAECDVCRAAPGITCSTDRQHPYAIVDAQWNTLCHFQRIEKAVRYRMAKRDDVIAQFGGALPKGLNVLCRTQHLPLMPPRSLASKPATRTATRATPTTATATRCRPRLTRTTAKAIAKA